MAIGAVAVALVAVALAGVGSERLPTSPSRPERPPNIVLLVIDSLRADKTGFGGGPQRLTPFLDHWAGQCTIYERAYAPSSWTIPVVASMMTGQYPSQHRATNFFARLASDTPTLAELLAAHGYATSAAGANSALRADAGFARGFDRYEIVGKPNMLNPKADGGFIVDTTLRWIDEVGPDRPHFLYLHFMDVHMPYRFHKEYVPPTTLQRDDGVLNMALLRAMWDYTPEEVQRLQLLYDGEVRYEDKLLRHFFAELDARGFLDHALVVITADHGEEFGGHKVFGHGSSLYEEAVRVPLLIRHAEPRRGRVREPVQLAGVTATILAAAGAARPSTVRVDPIPPAGAPLPPTVYTELPESGHKQNWLHKQAVVERRRKLLVTPKDELASYDLARDPTEHHPEASPDPTLTAALAAWTAVVRSTAAQERATVDDATRERLRGLGYLND